MRIAITGATGFIGQRLAQALLRAGHEVRALTRQPSAALSPAVQQIPGDLADPDALGSLVRGVDVVMHLAGAVRGAKAADFDRPNVEGTRNLLLQMQREAPGSPLLFISSLAAREPDLSHYAASKWQAEQLLGELGGGRPWLILRPPAVYGPGDREMLPVFRFMARTGIAPCAGKRSDRLSLIFVDDLVAAVMAWLQRATTVRGGCISLHDGHAGGYDWDELASLTGMACGRKVRPWEVPQPLLDLAANLNPLLCALLGNAPMMSPAKLRELRHPDWVCDNREIALLLGWEPRTSLPEGLAATEGWRD